MKGAYIFGSRFINLIRKFYKIHIGTWRVVAVVSFFNKEPIVRKTSCNSITKTYGLPRLNVCNEGMAKPSGTDSRSTVTYY